jgi:hypothetical protein
MARQIQLSVSIEALNLVPHSNCCLAEDNQIAGAISLRARGIVEPPVYIYSVSCGALTRFAIHPPVVTGLQMLHAFIAAIPPRTYSTIGLGLLTVSDAEVYVSYRLRISVKMLCCAFMIATSSHRTNTYLAGWRITVVQLQAIVESVFAPCSGWRAPQVSTIHK